MNNKIFAKKLYENPEFMHKHIGGKKKPYDNEKYINQQKNLIKKNNYQVPRFIPNKKSDNESKSSTQNINPVNLNKNIQDLYFRKNEQNYEPYVDYLYKRGLLDYDNTNITKFEKEYINIDSRFRNKIPKIDKSENRILDNNALIFTEGSNKIKISNIDKNIQIGDLITLNNVSSSVIKINSRNSDNQPSFEILPGTNIMKIFLKHNISTSYDDNFLQVKIDGISGDRGSLRTNSFLGNIPTNFINDTFFFKIRLDENDREISKNSNIAIPSNFLAPLGNENFFFILLPKIMQNQGYFLSNFNYTVQFLQISGIPINKLNADYPVNFDRQQGFHRIIDIDNNGNIIFQVEESALNTQRGGGSNIIFNKINSIKSGYPEPNDYIIDLDKVYKNIISAKLVSLEFPNTNYAINKNNNKLFWNNIDDGNFLYELTVPPGNYSPSELSSLLQDLFFEIDRINSDRNDIDFNYEKNHYVRIDINTNINLVRFRPFKEFILSKPFTSVEPEISINSSINDDIIDSQFTITIDHPSHGLTSTGKRILISGAIEYLGIPASIFNREHEVSEIIDENTYKIILPKFNLVSGQRSDTQGGVAVTIFIPDQMRLRFDQSNTIGSVLGFRNPGNNNSITNFSDNITNQENYAFEIDKNIIGKPINIEQNFLSFSGQNYVLLSIDPINLISNIGPVKNIFSKILLCDNPGQILFNSFININKTFDNPLDKLSQIKVSFFLPNGQLFDFNGLDHSFTLELVTLNERPTSTNINSNSGKNFTSVISNYGDYT